MKIIIDARLYSQTGVGRYIANLISHLGSIDEQNKYLLLVRTEDKIQIKLPNARWQMHEVNLPWHSLAEQLVLPFILFSEKPDLVHIPYFNMPIFYPGKFVVTIHDLIIDHFDTGKATTGPDWLYRLRRLAYQLVLSVGLRRASTVLTVSKTTKKELIDHYHLPEGKIVVFYEGVDSNFIIPTSEVGMEGKRREKYFLYVGNAYPHKNLSLLLLAFKMLDSKYELKLVGGSDYFYKRLGEEVIRLGLQDRVELVGYVSDEVLKKLYANSLGLVVPSLMEGFGLPILESIACGCPVLASDIMVFRELFGEAIKYFDPKSAADLGEKLQWFGKNSQSERQRLNQARTQILAEFSWEDLTRKTLIVYENSLSL